ncbi:nucleotide sugar dehydrogenase, partial [Actinomadura rugatobispora]
TRLGAHLTYHDPYVTTWHVDDTPIPTAGTDLPAALEAADLVLLLTGHADYDPETLAAHATLLFDARGHTRAAVRPTIETL